MRLIIILISSLLISTPSWGGYYTLDIIGAEKAEEVMTKGEILRQGDSQISEYLSRRESSDTTGFVRHMFTIKYQQKIYFCSIGWDKFWCATPLP